MEQHVLEHLSDDEDNRKCTWCVVERDLSIVRVRADYNSWPAEILLRGAQLRGVHRELHSMQIPMDPRSR